MAISGEVIGIRNIDNDFQELTVRRKSLIDGDNFKVFGVPNGYRVKLGDSVFLSDKLDFLDEKFVGFSWNSRISING
jgi:hypothetical protein